jgi:MGT family glycosyltransferase
MQVSKRFLFVWWEGGGNMPPAFHLIRQLIARGHEVRVLGEPVSEGAFRECGAEFVPFRRAPHREELRPETDLLRDWEARTPKQLLAILRDRLFFGPALGYAEDTLDQIELYAPHAVAIMDFTMGAMLAAERAGVPAAVIAPHILMYPVPGRPPIGPGLLPARHVVDRLRNWLISSASMRELAKAIPDYNVTRKKFDLAPVKSVFEQVERMQRILVLTSPSLELPGGPLPANVRYTGPILADPCWAGQCAGAWPPNERDPLVLLSLSTTFQNQHEVLRRAMEAFGKLRVRGLITLGPALDAREFAPPPNCVICSSAPHSQILPFAAAMVTHGGHGSVVRALAHGVPLVCVPMGRDQNDMAARVVYHGAGVRLNPSASVEQFAGAVQRVLSTRSFSAAAERLGEEIRGDAANSTAIEELEQLASHRYVPSISRAQSKSRESAASLVDGFEQAGRPLPAADAHGDDAVA